MRHTAVLVLGLVPLAVVMACGDTQPLPDIDATVEARVEVAKASLVAPTAAPLPTYTPLPTETPPEPTNAPPVMLSPSAIPVPIPSTMPKPTPTAAVDYQATVVALTAYWPTMEDLTLAVSQALRPLTPKEGIKAHYLEYFHVFSGVYIARECLAGRERSSEDFRTFVDYVIDQIWFSTSKLNEVGHRVKSDMVGIAKERIEADLPPAKFDCMRPFMYPETGEEAMRVAGLATAALNHNVPPMFQSQVPVLVQEDTANWLEMESPETPLLLWLLRKYGG